MTQRTFGSRPMVLSHGLVDEWTISTIAPWVGIVPVEVFAHATSNEWMECVGHVEFI